MAKDKNREPIEEAAEPLQGQTAFPGFEEPAPDAEAIAKAARKISFQMDMMRDPEDALISWGAPSDFYLGFMQDRFEKMVQKAAEITGADPEEIRSRATRTPEQDALLTEIAGKAAINRLDRFSNSLYFDALTKLYEGTQVDKDGNTVFDGFELDVIKEQSAVYFFALHGTVDPLAAGKLTPAQEAELTGIFNRLWAFYQRRIEELGEQAVKYGETLSAFIRAENPEQGTAETIEQTAKNYPSVITNHITKLTFPLDKVNSNIWRISLPVTQGSDARTVPLEINTANRKNKRKGKPAIINVTLDFSELDEFQIDRPLTPYDFRVMCAVGSLYDAGNKITSLSEIHEAMGNTGRPSSAQLDKIEKSLITLSKARVKISNEHEIEVNKGYPKLVYNGPMLLWDAIEAYIDNTLTEAAIQFYKLPPLYSFAKDRNQITAVPQKVLNSPINKTDANLAIENYLLKQIGHMRNSKKFPRKILFKTLYERCGIETPMQRKRAPDKIRAYLDHYKEKETGYFIKGYTETEDGITIHL